MADETATSTDASPSPGNAEARTPNVARSGRFAIAAALTSLCLWAYLRAGAGAAGLLGHLLLFAPVALLVAACLLPRIRSRARAGWGSLLVGIALPFALVSCELPEWVGRTSFDGATWKAAAGARSQERIRQVDALMASGALDRRTRAAVLELLGPDDSAEGTGWGGGYFADWGLVYWLGNERGWLSIDSEWLVFRFDGSGVVREYRIVRD